MTGKLNTGTTKSYVVVPVPWPVVVARCTPAVVLVVIPRAAACLKRFRFLAFLAANKIFLNVMIFL